MTQPRHTSTSIGRGAIHERHYCQALASKQSQAASLSIKCGHRTASVWLDLADRPLPAEHNCHMKHPCVGCMCLSQAMRLLQWLASFLE